MRKAVCIVIILLCVVPAVSLGAVGTYTASDEIIFNPERGFYKYGVTVDSTDYSLLRSQGYSLCYANILLDQFRTSDISAVRLNEIKSAFTRMRAAGIKCLVRISYNNDAGGQDATLQWMEKHLTQLGPVFEENADVIAWFQAGMIGAWGEWHSSSNDHHLNPLPVWNLLVEYLPADKCIAVRTPRYANILESMDSNPLTDQEAFSGTSRARIAHHNDCWLSNVTDWGTYPNAAIREAEKDQIANQSRYTPWGGETCYDENNPDYANCDIGVAEAKRFHATYLNTGWNPITIGKLKDGGCWLGEFAKKLGYRFELIQTILPDVITRGKEFEVEIRLKNVGWAPPFNERPVILVMFADGETIAEYPLSENADPRRWLPESGEITISAVLQAAETIEADKVSFALWLCDLYPDNRSNPDFSIRMANENVWDTAKGYNVLAGDIPVEDFQPANAGDDVVTWLVDETARVDLAGSIDGDGDTVEWELVSEPVSDAATITTPSDKKNISLSLTALGDYQFKLSAFDQGALVGSDTVMITVYNDNCTAAKETNVELLDGDFNADCVVDMADFTAMAGNWLESMAL